VEFIREIDTKIIAVFLAIQAHARQNPGLFVHSFIAKLVLLGEAFMQLAFDSMHGSLAL
jgi:hypothetical protein